MEAGVPAPLSNPETRYPDLERGETTGSLTPILSAKSES